MSDRLVRKPSAPKWVATEPNWDDAVFGGGVCGIMAGIAGLILAFLIDLLGWGGFGLDADMHWDLLWWLVVGMPVATFVSFFFVCGLAPLIWRPIEYRWSKQAEIHTDYQALPPSQRQELSAAYNAAIKLDPEADHDEMQAAAGVYERTKAAMLRRNELQRKKVKDPRLEEAYEVLKRISSEVAELDPPKEPGNRR